MNNDFKDLAAAILPAVLAAGARTMRYFGGSTQTQIKGDGSPVTIADQEAEEILLKALRETAPDIPVVAEEAAAAGQIPNVKSRFFLVDPLDGTKEFINGRNEFTVNIGLISNGAPTFGVIYAPALGKIYLTLSKTHAITADLPHNSPGCTLANLEPTASILKTRAEPDDGAMTIVASRSHGSDALESWLQDIKVTGRTNVGSSLKFCQVAQGDADIYPRFGPTMEWDTAAGHAIVLAAGGIVTLNDSATPLTYGKTETKFLNPQFIVWAQAQNQIRKAKATRPAS